MKKLFSVVFLFAILQIISCEALKMGTLQISNNSSNPYSLTIDGMNKGTINGNTSKDFKLAEGEHTVSATQQSGYLIYASVYSNTLNVYSGQKTNWNFP
ncbi:hypothetical protein LBMAG27_20440 [Bacteroidota bacterium]|nr:hypothetical protein LBMAG27_20440 [Bacteroidota bacterium]